MRSGVRCGRVYGLKTATKEFIDQLKLEYPKGFHITHKLNGFKLHNNGIFVTASSPTLEAWARLPKDKPSNEYTPKGEI